MNAAFFVRTEREPDLPPPVLTTGALAFVRTRLFSGPASTIFTLLGIAFLVWVVPPLVRFLLLDAVWTAPNGDACRAPGAGACWAYIWRKAGYFIYGSYPVDHRWR